MAGSPWRPAEAPDPPRSLFGRPPQQDRYLPDMPKLYVKTGCPWCREALDYFQREGIEHETIVVTGNPDAMAEMEELSGQSKAPTLDWDGEILADFGVEELEPFLERVRKS